MVLAHMVRSDEDALICDLAETYRIYDYRQLPATRVAVLACGLRDDSRIKMKLGGMKLPLETMLLAMIFDETKYIAWQRTKDAEKGRNLPKSFLNSLLEADKPKETMGFDTPDDFRAWRESMLKESD